MKLYKIEYTTAQFNTDRVAYEGTLADAKKMYKELCSFHGKHNVADYEAVEVPTDKPGLIAWLNANAGKG